MLIPIFYLFKKDEYDEALKYITQKMLSKDSSIDFEIYPSIEIDMESQSSINELKYKIVENSLKYLYGINAPQIANYLKVQDFVLDKVKDSLINYLCYINIKAEIIKYTPGCFTTPLLIMETKKRNRSLYEWNVDEWWDFEKEIERDKSMTCPLNEYLNLFLNLENITNLNFKHQLYMDGLIKKEELDNDFFTIKLLPCNNFNKVLNLMHAIFKYY